MPRRILHVAAMPFPSHQGTQVYIRQLCEQQSKRGHEVHLVTYWHGLEEGRIGNGYRIHRLSDFPKFRSLRSGPSWRKVVLDLRLCLAVDECVRKVAPEILHAHHYEALCSALPSAVARGLPLVYHAHTLLEPELPTYFSTKVARTLAGLGGLLADRLLPPFARVCVTVSPYLREALVAHGIREDRVIYIPPALQLDGDGPASRTEPTTKGADFVYLGNLDHYQGLSDMFHGLAKVAATRRRFSVKIISDSDPSEYVTLVERLGLRSIVAFEPHGDFPQALARMRSCKIALAPRKIPGGFPMKLINYLHAKKPVIASEHAACGLRHGREAFIYESVEDFARCASALLDDATLRGAIAREGWRYARENFVWGHNLDKLDKVYDSLCGTTLPAASAPCSFRRGRLLLSLHPPSSGSRGAAAHQRSRMRLEDGFRHTASSSPESRVGD